LILQVERLSDLDAGITVNAGLISGGTRPNVVAETAQAVIDVRAPSVADAERLERQFRNLTPADPRVTLQVEGGFERPPLERTAGVARLYSQAREVAQALGRDGLGPDGGGAHALHEHVLLADLPWRAAFLAGLLRRIGVSGGVK
jgi:glutamate carboxypeptidase